MRSWIFGAITLACLTVGASALACPRPVRPVQNVSLQASTLIERASMLESTAVSHDQSARAFEQEAETLLSRARALRNQAQFVNVSDRMSILSIADELNDRASRDRMLASSERQEAAGLRVEATSLRRRAAELTRLAGGGGWRGKRVQAPSLPLPSESGISL